MCFYPNVLNFGNLLYNNILMRLSFQKTVGELIPILIHIICNA